MIPVLFHIGPYPVHTFGVMVGIGFIAGMIWARREALRVGLPLERVMDLGFFSVLGGLVGARLLFVWINRDYFFSHPFKILAIWEGGIVWYGGLIAGTLVGVFLARLYRLPLWITADLTAPGIMYGLAFGRLGCFSVGDDHGRLVVSALGPRALDLFHKGLLFDPQGKVMESAQKVILEEGVHPPFWAVTFGPESLVQEDLVHLPLYPTQLMESALALLIFLFLALYRRVQRFPGELFALMFLLYAPVRSFVEYFRGDLGRGFFIPGVVSTSQGISIGIFLTGLILYFSLARKAKAKERS
jgi:phosphatidylglycerol:prolipoprotein diacylglycerol transferase